MLTTCADRECKRGHWSSIHSALLPQAGNLKMVTVFHYNTEMLTFWADNDGRWNNETNTVIASIGYGSVSDQNGMNKLFRHLNMPFYYVRKGGAQILSTDGKEIE